MRRRKRGLLNGADKDGKHKNVVEALQGHLTSFSSILSLVVLLIVDL